MYDGGPEACGSYRETCGNCAFADNDAGVCKLSCTHLDTEMQLS